MTLSFNGSNEEITMLGIGRRDGSVEVKPSVKTVLGSPPARPGGMPSNVPGGVPGRASSPIPPPIREPQPAAASSVKEDAPLPAASETESASSTSALTEGQGSKLFVGINIKLKGVEISDCDVLIVEGQVEATVHSKGMQIARPGTFTGTATIDIAEIFGEFSGDLTARTRLVVHGTGRVSGTIRYGKLIVEEGGELTGDVKQLDGSADAAQPSLMLEPDSRTSLERARSYTDLHG